MGTPGTETKREERGRYILRWVQEREAACGRGFGGFAREAGLFCAMGAERESEER